MASPAQVILADTASELRDTGLRATRPRAATLLAVREHPHGDVEEIASAVRARLGRVSMQAVYDALRALHRAGMVRHVEPAGSPARYEARVGDNHHHVVCRECGTIADVDCTIGAAPCLEPSNTCGYVIDEAEVTFWGLCPVCQERRHAEPAGRLGVGAGRTA